MIENSCAPSQMIAGQGYVKRKGFLHLGNMWEVGFPPESWAPGEERCVFVLCMKAVSVWEAPSWQVAFLAPGM